MKAVYRRLQASFSGWSLTVCRLWCGETQPAVKDRELAIVPPILLAIPGLKALLIKSTDTMVQKLLDKYADVSAVNPLSKVCEGRSARWIRSCKTCTFAVEDWMTR